MLKNLYLIVVVLFRTASICAIGTALLTLLLGFVITRSGAMLLTVLSVLPLLAGGALLWLAAKPAAKLIVSGLDE